MKVLKGRVSAAAALSGSLIPGRTLVGALNTYIHPTAHDYVKQIVNKPQINSVELLGNTSFDNLGLEELSNMELEALLQS